MSGGVVLLGAARDLRLAGRRRFEALLPVVFFIVAASLFPLGVGPEPQVLRQSANDGRSDGRAAAQSTGDGNLAGHGDGQVGQVGELSGRLQLAHHGGDGIISGGFV